MTPQKPRGSKGPPLFSPALLVMNKNNDIGNPSIDHAIDRNLMLLQEHFFEPLLQNYDYSKLLSDIRNAANNLALQGELENSWKREPNEYDNETTIILNDAKQACLYIELARINKDNKFRDKAWAFNNNASLLVGEVMAKSEAIRLRNHGENLSFINSKNARGRNKFISRVKERAALLIEEMKPPEGWPSKEAVVIGIERPLAEFIDPEIGSRNKSSAGDTKPQTMGGVGVNNLHAQLKNWMLKDQVVCNAWEKNRRPPKNKMS